MPAKTHTTYLSKPAAPTYRCKDCIHSYGYYSPNAYNGEPTLCHCRQDTSRSRIVDELACIYFAHRA